MVEFVWFPPPDPDDAVAVEAVVVVVVVPRNCQKKNLKDSAKVASLAEPCQKATHMYIYILIITFNTN